MAVPYLLMNNQRRGLSGYGGGSDDDGFWVFVTGLLIVVALGFGTLVVLVWTGVIEQSHKSFKDYPGDIVAGYPAEVVNTWTSKISTGKYGEYGTKLYLVTEDCDDGSRPSPGKGVNENCRLMRHKVQPDIFRKPVGHIFRWNDSGDDDLAEIHEHRYWTGDSGYRSYTTVYRFGLMVRQCRPAYECVEDIVPVRFSTWFNARPGETIQFKGELGEVVS